MFEKHQVFPLTTNTALNWHVVHHHLFSDSVILLLSMVFHIECPCLTGLWLLSSYIMREQCVLAMGTYASTCIPMYIHEEA